MIYSIQGTQKYFIEDALKKELMTFSHQEYTLLRFDARLVPIQEIIQELYTMSLDGLKKIGVIDYPYFFLREEKQKIEDLQDYDVLERVLTNPDPDIPIFFISDQSYDERKTFVKLLKKHQMIDVPTLKPYQWKDPLKSVLNSLNLSLTYQSIDYLIETTYPDFDRLIKECEKLSLYDSSPNDHMVKTIVASRTEDNVFQLSNHLIQLRIDQALKTFMDLKSLKEEPVYLLTLLSRQFQLMAKVMYLSQQGQSIYDIAKILKVHDYRVKLIVDGMRAFPLNNVEKVIVQLHELDEQIKSGSVDRYFAMSWFITNFKTTIF
jgi:DNA polymerase III subunit delta